MHSVDKSLEDIIRLRKERLGKPIKYSTLKRLKQSQTNIPPQLKSRKTKSITNPSPKKSKLVVRDAREKLQSRMNQTSDLRVKLEIKNSNPAIIQNPQINNR